MISDEQIQHYIDEGKFWRAREVLQGRIANAGYDVELFERLGVVLLCMHDIVNAGKYLFLSGKQDACYEEAITLFLDRYARAEGGHFLAALPKCIGKVRFEVLPQCVVDELFRHGVKEADFKQRAGRELPAGGASNGILGYAVVGGLLLLLLGFAVSSVRGLIWLFEAIFG